MYHDLRFKALERQERTSRDPRIGPGTALFVSVYSLFGVCNRKLTELITARRRRHRRRFFTTLFHFDSRARNLLLDRRRSHSRLSRFESSRRARQDTTEAVAEGKARGCSDEWNHLGFRLFETIRSVDDE